MTTFPNVPAFPMTVYDGDGPMDCTVGLTKREYFAAIAFQGVMAASALLSLNPKETVKMSVLLADELIEELNSDD